MAKERTSCASCNRASTQGAELVVDGRDFSLQGYEDGFFIGPHLFDRVTPDMEIYQGDLRPGPVDRCARGPTRRR
jgi:malonate-semialdehyde dehydrogenase (acetylating)/methylmalonate-semialdehyde dehydrogenase